MNSKKIMVLLLFAIAIIGIITPVNAELSGYVSKSIKYDKKPVNKLFVCIQSDIGIGNSNWKSTNYVKQRKTELNKINKIVIKVKGYNSTTIKKPSTGWQTYQYADAFQKYFTVKGATKSLLGKDYSIKLYNKNNKLIRSDIKSKLRSN